MGNQSTSAEGNSGLKFNKNELKVLYKNFVKLDQDHSGLIEPDEFFDVPELQDNPIVQRIINVFDKNHDGKISFYEFVSGLSLLTISATDSSEDKMKTAFQIYDLNMDGYISNGDLFNTLKILVGDNLEDVQLQQLVDRTMLAADKDMDGRISFEEFCEYCKDIRIAEMFSIEIFK